VLLIPSLVASGIRGHPPGDRHPRQTADAGFAPGVVFGAVVSRRPSARARAAGTPRGAGGAAAVAVLASYDASFITASAFLVDGRISAAYVTPL